MVVAYPLTGIDDTERFYLIALGIYEPFEVFDGILGFIERETAEDELIFARHKNLEHTCIEFNQFGACLGMHGKRLDKLLTFGIVLIDIIERRQCTFVKQQKDVFRQVTHILACKIIEGIALGVIAAVIDTRQAVGEQLQMSIG